VRVRYTLPALADLDDILDYLAPRSPKGAARVQSRIKSFIALFADAPLIGTRTDDPTIRRLVVTPYSYALCACDHMTV
jgi:plasmid stabilization system protein ParE